MQNRSALQLNSIVSGKVGSPSRLTPLWIFRMFSTEIAADGVAFTAQLTVCRQTTD